MLSASRVNTVTCPVNAFVEATPISGPTWMYVPECVSRGMDAPTTLLMPYTNAPLLLAICMAASVSAVSPLWLTAITMSCGVITGCE